MSELGRGVASISFMLTISRLHNITANMGLMRKITGLARNSLRMLGTIPCMV